MADDKKNPLGPTGRQVQGQIKRIREARGLSYRQLSDLLTEMGRPIPTLGLSRIEKGERRVDVDDLVALAGALRVNPSALLLPPDVEGEVDVTGLGTIPARDAWAWVDGRQPLTRPGEDPGEVFADFQTHARPRGFRAYLRMGEDGTLRVALPYGRDAEGIAQVVEPGEE